ncbi:MAG TPA: fumarate hydratase [bacterium (Candidatus Stahlbacteria)]|nr:fumarate hydratase [Candidatus Stahlbacteria bacterium]
MREIDRTLVVDTVADLCIKANTEMGEDLVSALKEAREKEESDVGKEILEIILENIEIARNEQIPACQDTGTAVVFVEIGEDVSFSYNLTDAIFEGVRKGYQEGFLRKSMCDPITRKNTKDNTPPIIHYEFVPGDKLKITVAPKGGGSENMSEARVFAPAAGIEGIKDFVVDRVERSQANPCPPIIVGVGIGGNFEHSTYLAKKALLRNIGQRHPEKFYAQVERELKERINRLGIGPQGLGGRFTCLDVFVEYSPCHVASLPVAVNINCHVARHKSKVL